MKKLLVFFLSIFFVLVVPVKAQSGNWVALESDANAITEIGQIITVTFGGSLDTVINGAGIVLDYDPECLRVEKYQSGTLLPDAVSFPQENSGSLDLTYYYQGETQALAGEGSIIIVSFEALDLCDTTISVGEESVVLDVVGETGIAVGIPNVEYRNLNILLGEEIITPTPIQKDTAIDTQTPDVEITQDEKQPSSNNFILIIV